MLSSPVDKSTNTWDRTKPWGAALTALLDLWQWAGESVKLLVCYSSGSGLTLAPTQEDTWELHIGNKRVERKVWAVPSGTA